MASLCMSPVQAGIIFFRTANSSFILLRRRLSIKLCAVLRAILRPAALVALGCFLPPLADVPAAPPPLPEALAVAVVLAALLAAPPFPVLLPSLGAEASATSSCRGFIWIILRERVGGGGRANALLLLLLSLGSLAADERRRALTVSAACMG